jgi:transcriptional regulator with XRE-family HTH domain
MSPQEFHVATLRELQEQTGIHASRWSRYFNSRIAMTESTLARAARSLGMSQLDLFEAVNERRRITRKLLESRLAERTIA